MPLIDKPAICERDCGCADPVFDRTKLIVVTGGPGAGKTAVLEIIRKALCQHVVILPEAASIVFGGGFWRLESFSARCASQRAILHIQQEIERLVLEEGKWPLGLCDRGTLDGLAYWAGEADAFWDTGRTTMTAEYERYHTVIHLRTPTEALGYNKLNPLRIESAIQARAIDEKIGTIWSGHPRYHVIESSADFLAKARKAMACVADALPPCFLQSLKPSF